MYKPDDNDIDRLSREAAEHYHAPGPPAWDALRQTLDRELPQEKEKKRRGFLFFFLLAMGLLVAGSAVWYGISTKGNKPTDTSTNKPADKVAGTPAGTQKIIPADNLHAAAKNNNTPEERTAKPAPGGVTDSKAIPGNNSPVTALSKHTVAPIVNKPVLSSGTATGEPAATDHTAINNTRSKKDIAVGAGTSAPLHTAALRKKQQQNPVTRNDDMATPHGKRINAATGQPVIKSKSVKAGNTQAVEEMAANGTVTNDANNNKTVSQPPPAVAAPAAMDNHTVDEKMVAPTDTVAVKQVAPTVKKDSAKATVAKAKNKSKSEKAILLGITGGLDLSTIKFTYASDAGYNIGFMGGYQFSQHWSVYTGIVYTKKNYKLNGGDYHPPKDYWTTYVNLETVEGYCRMWELPLQARYTFNPQAKTAFFASTGLSSYFMKQQQYEYSYKTNMVQTNARWTDNNNLNHVFSILDLSAGFQKSIGKRMNWQVEPYAKIPLGGVGFGNIRLSSFGLNLTVQYKQPVKR